MERGCFRDRWGLAKAGVGPSRSRGGRDGGAVSVYVAAAGYTKELTDRYSERRAKAAAIENDRIGAVSDRNVGFRVDPAGLNSVGCSVGCSARCGGTAQGSLAPGC